MAMQHFVHPGTGVAVSMDGEDSNIIRLLIKFGYVPVDVKATAVLEEAEARAEEVAKVEEPKKARKPRATKKASKE